MAAPTEAKRRLLDELKRGGPTTVSILARSLGVSDAAVRQHLAALEELGLVTSSADAPAGRGRPPVRWSLTPEAHELFPDHHAELTVELLGAMRRAIGDDALERVIEARAGDQIAAYRRAGPGERSSVRARLDALARERTREGYMAEVVREGRGRYLLVEHHCPVCEAARACTGLCRGEWEVFRKVLGDNVEVERTEHLLSGGTRCVYRVTERAAP
jgi:predicted ArsR family transcriptional regulator